MPLNVTGWVARLFVDQGHVVFLPFDKNFKPGERGNHVTQSLVGKRPYWQIFVDFPSLNYQDPSYPHFIELHDNEDFATFHVGAFWEQRTGTDQGYGPVPTETGKHRVRIVLLNKDQKPILSQSGEYFVDVG